MAALVVVALAYHCFGYVLNDVIDLDIDRTEPRRVATPLVRGTVTPGWAAGFALLCVPAAFLVAAAIHGGISQMATLIASFVLGGAYDLWGKRFPFPPFTDLIQGLGWGALTLFGAFLAGGATGLSLVVAAYAVVLVVMVNGVHGALRDLANDAARGARSTAIFLKCRSLPQGGVSMSYSMIGYAAALQTALSATLLIGWIVLVGAHAGVDGADLAALVIFTGSSVALLVEAIRRSQDPIGFRSAGMLHMLTVLATPIVVLWSSAGAQLRASLVIVYVLPIVGHAWLVPSLRWGWVRFGDSLARLRVVFAITRFHNCLASAAAAELGAFLGGGVRAVTTGRTHLAALALALIVGASNVANDVNDVRPDKLAKPWRPIPSGRMTLSNAVALAWILGIGGVLVGTGIGPSMGALTALLLLGGLAYSFRLKSTVLVGNALVGVLVAAMPVYGAHATSWIGPSVLMASGLAFLFMLPFEVLKTVADRGGDQAAGLRTLATQFGAVPSLRVFQGLAAAFVLATTLPWVLGRGSNAYLAAMVTAAGLPTVCAIVLVARRGERLADPAVWVMKLAWITGMAALSLLR